MRLTRASPACATSSLTPPTMRRSVPFIGARTGSAPGRRAAGRAFGLLERGFARRAGRRTIFECFFAIFLRGSRGAREERAACVAGHRAIMTFRVPLGNGLLPTGQVAINESAADERRWQRR